MKKYINILLFFKQIGLKTLFFRLLYELKKKYGYFDYLNRKILRSKNLNNEIKVNTGIIDSNFSQISFINQAEKALNGELFAFSNEYLNYTQQDNFLWNYNPITKKTATNKQPWHKIPDFGQFGDIKLIWEASRFPQLYHYICAYSETKDRKYALAAKNAILDWIDKNPYPYGVNYKCGQEITFRIFAWVNALDYFKDYFNQQDLEKISSNIRISLKRIKLNYNYAAKWVRNNHSVSEAAGLLVGALVFPDFPESSKYVKLATNYLVKELDYQVFEDGVYIQNSLNYQRLVIDVLSYVILISKKTNYNLPSEILDKHKKLTLFLASFVAPDGSVPNYGPNDGAHLFPISEYRDFRESLNFASAINDGKRLFESNYALCEFFGINSIDLLLKNVKPTNFEQSGFYRLHNNIFDCFIRCHTYKTRPSHSDALHLDISINGKNVFCDTGSYSYNTTKENKKHFSGIFGHNTVIIDDEDYMKPVFNFGKSNWPVGLVNEFSDAHFDGEHLGYIKSKNIKHRRAIQLLDDTLIVKDFLTGINKKTKLKQVWHTEFTELHKKDESYVIGNLEIQSNISGKIEPSKVSRYYNSYTDARQLVYIAEVENDFIIETKFILKNEDSLFSSIF